MCLQMTLNEPKVGPCENKQAVNQSFELNCSKEVIQGNESTFININSMFFSIWSDILLTSHVGLFGVRPRHSFWREISVVYEVIGGNGIRVRGLVSRTDTAKAYSRGH